MFLVEEFDFEDGTLIVNQTEVIELYDNFHVLKNNIHHRIVTLQFSRQEVDLRFLSCSIAYDFIEELTALCCE